MKLFSIRRFFVIIFAMIFCLLTSALLAQAHAGELTLEQIEQLEQSSVSAAQIYVESTSLIYPIDEITTHPGLAQVKIKRPWYELVPDSSERVFRQSELEKEVKSWNHLKKDFFLKDLERLGESQLARKYPDFAFKKIERAQEEVRRIKRQLAYAEAK